MGRRDWVYQSSVYGSPFGEDARGSVDFSEDSTGQHTHFMFQTRYPPGEVGFSCNIDGVFDTSVNPGLEK